MWSRPKSLYLQKPKLSPSFFALVDLSLYSWTSSVSIAFIRPLLFFLLIYCSFCLCSTLCTHLVHFRRLPSSSWNRRWAPYSCNQHYSHKRSRSPPHSQSRMVKRRVILEACHQRRRRMASSLFPVSYADHRDNYPGRWYGRRGWRLGWVPQIAVSHRWQWWPVVELQRLCTW